MASNLTRPNQKIYFTEEELERIVSYIPNERPLGEKRFVDDENVSHKGTEIYSRMGIVSEIFEFNFDVEDMMS